MTTLEHTFTAPAISFPQAASPPAPERAHRVTFLCMLTEALASHGTATHELEETIERVARRLGVPARVSATPTTVLIVLGDEDHERTRMIVPRDAGTHLARLTRLNRIAAGVESGAVSARDGIAALREALREGPQPSLIADAASTAAIAAAVLVVLGAPHTDLVAGAALAMLVTLTVTVCARHPRLARVSDFAAAAVAGAGAAVLARLAGPVDVFPVTLAGLLPLLPGLGLTVAIGEISSGSLVAGASRLIGSLTVLLSLGFGVTVGYRVAGASDLALTLGRTTAYPWWALAGALVAVAAAMTIAFRARGRDLPVILVSATLAMASARWGATALGPEFGAFTGALVVGTAGILYERVTRNPAQVALLPGILLLVPGSVGFSSVQSLIGADAMAGIEGVFSMFVAAVGIVTGLLLTGVLAPTGTAGAREAG